jgi:hypothetical protein
MPYVWTPDKMITLTRVKLVATRLFPDDEHDGDCKSEVGRIGEPCRVCAMRNLVWKGRLYSVRRAMFEAFGHDPDKYPEAS